MTILGLNAYHADSAACLLVGGKLIAAAEEERFRRIKHWAGLPTQAIDYCLKESGLTIRDIDVNRKPGVNNWRRLAFVLRHRPDPRLMWQKITNIRSASTVKQALEEHYGAGYAPSRITSSIIMPISLQRSLSPALKKRPVCRSMGLVTSPARPSVTGAWLFPV